MKYDGIGSIIKYVECLFFFTVFDEPQLICLYSKSEYLYFQLNDLISLDTNVRCMAASNHQSEA